MTDLFEHQAQRQAAAPPTRRRSAATKRAAAKRRRRRQQRTAVVLVVVLGVVGAGGYLLWDRLDDMVGDLPFIGSQSEDYPGPGDTPVEVEIPEGATGAQMGAALVEADVVASTAAFNEAFGANPAAAGIQPGTYQLLTQMKASDAVAALVKNEKIQTDVTIPEGYSVEQIVERVGSVTTISAEDLQAALKKPKSFGLPEQADGNAEGWLFPTTYSVQPGDDATSLLTKMVEQTTSELKSAGVAKGDWEDALIKASLVEREAKHAEDRPKMARAIENRLDRGMTLDIDAAVAYGAGKPGTQLTREDLSDPDNEYNLYEHMGLPPTPISNPGSSAIEAVADPADGNWVFWVAVNLDTGETKFSETYEQHQEYVAELRAWEAENS